MKRLLFTALIAITIGLTATPASAEEKQLSLFDFDFSTTQHISQEVYRVLFQIEFRHPNYHEMCLRLIPLNMSAQFTISF